MFRIGRATAHGRNVVIEVSRNLLVRIERQKTWLFAPDQPLSSVSASLWLVVLRFDRGAGLMRPQPPEWTNRIPGTSSRCDGAARNHAVSRPLQDVRVARFAAPALIGGKNERDPARIGRLRHLCGASCSGRATTCARSGAEQLGPQRRIS